MRASTTPPSLEDIVEMAEQAFAAIPEALRDLVRGAAIVVEEVAGRRDRWRRSASKAPGS